MNIIELQGMLHEASNKTKPVRSIVLSEYDCRYDWGWRNGVDEWLFRQKALITFTDDTSETVVYYTKYPSTHQQYNEKNVNAMREMMENGSLTKDEIVRLFFGDV